MEAALAARSIPDATGAEVWGRNLDRWRGRGVLERTYSRRPRKTVAKRKRRKLTDLQRAKSMPPRVETGEELVRLGEKVWQDRAMLSKAVEMWGAGLSSGAVRQAQCSRIGWARRCKEHGHLWHHIFRCGLRFCPLCMSYVYEELFYDAVARLDPVACRLVPEWPVKGKCPRRRVIAKIDFTIRNDGQMPSAEKVRWFNRAIRRFFTRLARQNKWTRGEWGAAWSAVESLAKAGKLVGEAADCEARDPATRMVVLPRGKETQVPVRVQDDFSGASVEVRATDPATGAIFHRLKLHNAVME